MSLLRLVGLNFSQVALLLSSLQAALHIATLLRSLEGVAVMPCKLEDANFHHAFQLCTQETEHDYKRLQFGSGLL